MSLTITTGNSCKRTETSSYGQLAGMSH